MLNAGLDHVLQQSNMLQEHEPSCKGLIDCLADQGINSQTTEALSEKLQQILLQAVPIAQTTCNYTKAGHSNYTKYPKRTASRKNMALAEYRTAINHALQQYNSCKRNDVHDWHQKVRLSTEESRKKLNCEYQQHFPQPPQTTDATIWADWQEKCKKQQQKAKSDAAKLRDQDRQSSLSNARRRLQTQYLTQRKQVHKKIFGKTGTTAGLTALQDKETGIVLNGSEEIREHVFKYFQKQANPVFGPKTGMQALKTPTTYPWQRVGCEGLDSFNMQTSVGDPDSKPVPVLPHIKKYNMFLDAIRRLKNGKQPGPDGIPNELIKHLPDNVHQEIHKLFVVMWATGHTPNLWKESSTILLHKKGSELDLNNYRSIALAKTLYKLWTSIVHECLSIYAENNNILSSQQEGFRQNRNTHRQLQMLQHVFSDAKICEQDLYLLYIDFSSAFNTIDHDKLLCIMNDLGFTRDAIRVVQNLYTDAKTKVRLPYIETDAISIDRGTIQGDTLSPFLFIIFLEPLLRWPQSGGRGYKYGCLQGDMNNKIIQQAH